MTHADQIRRYLVRCRTSRTVAEISRATGIPRSSVRRVLIIGERSDIPDYFLWDGERNDNGRICGLWTAFPLEYKAG